MHPVLSYTIASSRRTYIRLWNVFLLAVSFMALPVASKAQEPIPSMVQREMSSVNTAPVDTLQILAVIDQAMLLARDQPDSTLKLLRWALEESRAAGFIDGMDKSVHQLGIHYMNKGMYKQALATFRDALSLCSRIESLYIRLPFIHNCMGNI